MSHEQAERLIHLLEENLITMATLSEDVEAATAALTALTDKVTELEAQLAAAEPSVSAADQTALEDATTAANAVLTPSGNPPTTEPTPLSVPNQAIDATVGSEINSTIAADGGVAPVTFTSNDLLAGLSLSSDGIVTGPASTAGTTPINVVATDATGATASGTVTITIV